MVRTAPRPCLIEEVPWLCSRSVTASKSRPGKQRFEPLEERRVDGQRVGERAVHRAGLLDDDLAVALEDVRLDLADVLVDQRVDRLLAGEDPRARLADAGRAERIGGAGPAEWRLGSLLALQKRRRRPLGLEGFSLEPRD